MLLLHVVLHFFLIGVLLVSATPPVLERESSEFPRVKFPPYVPKDAAEHLISASAQNFYSRFKDAVPYVQDFLTSRVERIGSFNEKSEEKPCRRAILQTVVDYASGRNYARKMRDSTGRRESGLMKGNYLWFGNYFECEAASGNGISGQWCKTVFSGTPNSTFGLTLGICVPDVCSSEELTGILQPLIPNDGSSNDSVFVTVVCPPSPGEIDLEAADIVAIVILSLLLALVIGGTSFELISIAIKCHNGTSTVEESKLPVTSRLALSFSVIKNTTNLFDTTRKEGNLNALDGLRFISMAWIILGHTLNMSLIAVDNYFDIAEYYVEHGSLQGIANSTFSVDTFFFLSGLLVAYLGMREMDKTGGKLNVPLMYLMRFLRLTPPLAIVMMWFSTLYEQTGEGPIYYTTAVAFKGLCQKYWWTHLLYINNLYPAELGEECISWAWYLANDMQFYLLSPIFLYLLYKKPKLAYGVIASVILISMGITGGISAFFGHMNDVITMGSLFSWMIGMNAVEGDFNVNETLPPPGEESYWNEIYIRPWCRIGVYLIGMTTGYIIHVTKRNIKMSKIFAVAMWIAVIAVELTVIYGFCGAIYNNVIPPQEAMSFYDAVSRPVWALGLAWVTIACVNGYGGPINTLLSWKVFAPLSRLTYSAYLLHPMLLMYMFTAKEYDNHFQLCLLIYYFLAALILSYLLAYMLYMSVEAPVGGIQKVIFSKSKSSQSEKNLKAVVMDNTFAEAESDSIKKDLTDEASERRGEDNEPKRQSFESDRL